MSDKLIALAKELCKDQAALKRLKMHRTTASHKRTYGLSRTFKQVLVSTLQSVSFSLNMDESTSSNVCHMFTILVAYFSEMCNDIVVEDLGSLDVPSFASENLFSALKDLFETHDLPWSNLLSVLSDSASIMRGRVNAAEVKNRSEGALNLLDIDGESCHQMHNVVKKFTFFFEYVLENLFRDVSNEFQYSADSVDLLKEIYFHLGLRFYKPLTHSACRWLSVLGTCIQYEYMIDVYKLYFSGMYRAFIEKQIKKCDKAKDLNGKEDLEKQEQARQKTKKVLLRKYKVSDESLNALETLEMVLINKFRAATPKGQEMKIRVIPTIFDKPLRLALKCHCTNLFWGFQNL